MNTGRGFASNSWLLGKVDFGQREVVKRKFNFCVVRRKISLSEDVVCPVCSQSHAIGKSSARPIFLLLDIHPGQYMSCCST